MAACDAAASIVSLADLQPDATGQTCAAFSVGLGIDAVEARLVP